MLIVAAALFCSCGENRDSTDVQKPLPRDLRVTLDGYVTPANVAVEMAIARGYFTAVGLKVFAAKPIFPKRPVTYVSRFIDDFGIAQQPQVALTQRNGAPVVAVGALVSQPTAAMIWLRKSRIHGIADLKGRSIAVSGIPAQEKLLESILGRVGLGLDDVEVKRVGYKLVPTLLKGKVDAIFGGSWNIDGIALRQRGVRPVIRRVQELGVPSYDELVVIARRDRVARSPQVVRKFMLAVTRAAAAVKRDPVTALKVISESGERNFEFSPDETRAQMKATLATLSPTGHIDPEQADALLTWMHDEDIVGGRPTSSGLFTDEYLPPGG